MLAGEPVDWTGRTVDHYVIVALIRGGSQGRVYRARDQVLNRDVAIKVMNRDGRQDTAGHGLIGEARVLSSLNHPNVAEVYDFVTHEQRDFMVMEFIAGATLQEVLASGPLPFSEVIRLGTQLARGIAAVHAGKAVHCDIKPANLKITSAGLLKIVDFGIARTLPPAAIADSAPTTGLTVAGTLPYMAPEVLRGHPADERSDIFSIGAVLYEMATACRAFPQRMLPDLIDAIETCDVIPPSRINPNVPGDLDRVILSALRRLPGDRYQHAIDVADALLGLVSVTPRPVAPRPAPTRWWQLPAATRWWLPARATASYAVEGRQSDDSIGAGIAAPGQLA
jgi:serine/threonine-protein kinase